MNSKYNAEREAFPKIDIRIIAAVTICFLTATILNHFEIFLSYDGKQLEIIQKMTPCITCCLCCQDSFSSSIKASINRVIITLIGGLAAIVAILLNNSMGGNEWIMAFLVTMGVVVTLISCRAAKVPYINCRAGVVAFILVTNTLPGSAGIIHGCMRVISTVYGAVVSALVCMLADEIEVYTKGS